MFLNSLQLTMLQGSHAWEDEPRAGDWYIGGMDVAGEERPAAHMPGEAPRPSQYGRNGRNGRNGRSKRDSSVLTIGRVHFNEFNLPCIEVTHQQWWTGRSHLDQYAAALALIEHWDVRALVIDATGLGAGLASMLVGKLGAERVTPFTFTRPAKSRLAYQLLSLLNSGRLKLYEAHSAPMPIYDECWRQLRLARYRLPAPETIDFYVDPADGHDDFLASLALLTEAIHSLPAPPASTLIRPKGLYRSEGWY
jgi:hypothetical protein